MLYLRVALPFSFSYGHIIFPAKNLFLLYDKMGLISEPEYKKKIISYFSIGQGIIIANLFPFKLFNLFSD
jgi:hypothetical protein